MTFSSRISSSGAYTFVGPDMSAAMDRLQLILGPGYGLRIPLTTHIGYQLDLIDPHGMSHEIHATSIERLIGLVVLEVLTDQLRSLDSDSTLLQASDRLRTMEMVAIQHKKYASLFSAFSSSLGPTTSTPSAGPFGAAYAYFKKWKRHAK
jgi:hypothetical protein